MMRTVRNVSKLIHHDPEMHNLIKKEALRQREGLELIASENITSTSVLECLGSILTNKYSEGLPGKRYYGGNEVIDEIENLCINRALETFRLDKEKWGVNVQPYSGSSANFAAYTALLQPHDRIMGLDLPSGGHLTHGFFTSKTKVSATSVYFESLPYRIKEDGYIDYDNLEELATVFKPKMIICGYSAYSRDLDYERFRKIADMNKSYLLCDMAHFSGLVATEEFKNPFEYCDIVTTTTHKTLRGPRSGIILAKSNEGLEKKLNSAVFPGSQGGPLMHVIAAKAVAFLEALKPSFKEYQQQVVKNAQAMAQQFIQRGYRVISGRTESHVFLVDLRPQKLTGKVADILLGKAHITVNKNSIPNDPESPFVTSGIRLGTPAITTRGFKEDEARLVAQFIADVLEQPENEDNIKEVKGKVMALTSRFPVYEK